MNDGIYLDFLRNQLKAAREMADASDLLHVAVLPGVLPNRFLARFRCRGLALSEAGQVVEQDDWSIGIHLPRGYLLAPIHVTHILAYLGPHPQPFHPNVHGPFVCMNLQPGMELSRILFGLADLLSWRLYASHDALNPAAAQWARQQPLSRFPIDRRPLGWRRPPAHEAPPRLNLP